MRVVPFVVSSAEAAHHRYTNPMLKRWCPPQDLWYPSYRAGKHQTIILLYV